MNRRSQIAFVALLIGIVVALLLWLGKPSPGKRGTGQDTASERPPESRGAAQPGAAAVRAPDPRALQQVPPHPLAVSFGENPDSASSEPAVLLEILQFYRMEFGAFPAGQENREIMNALKGNNPGKLPVFPIDHPRINRHGDLLDAWGTPFVFHPVSSQYLEVRSCGPDREIFTDDDILVPELRSGL